MDCRTPHLSGNLYISLQILRFLNGCILFNVGPINTKLKDFVKLGVLFLIIWSCVVNPIIDGLIPRPLRYEIWQFSERKKVLHSFLTVPGRTCVLKCRLQLWKEQQTVVLKVREDVTLLIYYDGDAEDKVD